MTRDEARTILEAGEDCLYVGNWCFCGLSMSCSSGCCEDYYDNVEQALNVIIDQFADGDWDKVTTL